MLCANGRIAPGIREYYFVTRPRLYRMQGPVTTIAATTLLVVMLGGCASTNPANPDTIAARANAVGIAPDLVYTTTIEGYDLAPQSVGPGAADGMSATWFNQATGAMVTIRTDRGDMTAQSCAQTPLADAPDEPVTCTYVEGVWHRTGGGVHEYVAVRDEALIVVIGGNGAPGADLLTAAQAVRVPSNAELDALFSDLPDAPDGPVERGDLPENGDGAPIDTVGPGG